MIMAGKDSQWDVVVGAWPGTEVINKTVFMLICEMFKCYFFFSRNSNAKKKSQTIGNVDRENNATSG